MNARLLRLGVSCLGLMLSATGAGAQQVSDEMRTPAAGIVEKIHIKDGDKIKKGALLIEFDSTKAKRELVEAKESVAAASAAFNQANTQSQRVAQLFNRGLIDRAGFDMIEADRAQAQIKLTAQFAIESAKLVALEQTKIHALTDGIVIKVQVKAGEAVKAGNIVATLRESESGTQDKVRELMKERHAVLVKIAKLAAEKYKAGQIPGVEALRAQRNVLESSLELAQTSAERIVLLRENLELTEQLKKNADARLNAGVGSQTEALQAEALMLEMRIRLEREAIKSKIYK